MAEPVITTYDPKPSDYVLSRLAIDALVETMGASREDAVAVLRRHVAAASTATRGDGDA